MKRTVGLMLVMLLSIGVMVGCSNQSVDKTEDKSPDEIIDVTTGVPETPEVEEPAIVDNGEVIEGEIDLDTEISEEYPAYLEVQGNIIQVEDSERGKLLFIKFEGKEDLLEGVEGTLEIAPDTPVSSELVDDVVLDEEGERVVEPAVEGEISEDVAYPVNPVDAVFVITDETYLLGDYIPTVGDTVKGFYPSDTMMIMIYPPQYSLSALVKVEENKFTKLDTFNEELVSKDNQLKLNLDETVEIINGEIENLSNKDLLVEYDITTRSIPAQTTPIRVVVLK